VKTYEARPRRAGAILLAAGLLLLGALGVFATARADSGYIGVAPIDGRIDRTTSRYISRILEQARNDSAALVVIELDTPGGLDDAARDVVESILGSQIPVAVYVAPQGARAASAGTFILAAGHVAAMAPGTTVGAADATEDGVPIGEDTRAFIRSIADARGRPAEPLETTLTNSRAYAASEALGLGVIDLVANDRADLLNQLDGRAITTAGGTVTLASAGVPVQEFDHTFFERVLGVLADPNIAALLIAFGCLGILIELLHPGTLGPGIAGAGLLAAGFVGAGQLPLNWLGFALIVGAMVLFYIEVQAAGVGVAGFVGAACLVVGLLFLFGNFFGSPDIQEPSFRPSPWLIGAMSAVAVAALGGFVYLARTTGSRGFSSPEDAQLVGRPGLAVSDLQPSGRIDVGGVEWIGTTDTGDRIREGDAVRVVGVYGNVLKVVRLTTPEADAVLRESTGGRWSRLLRRRM
jgi:membrane-bound serine protease (ClpP class)